MSSGPFCVDCRHYLPGKHIEPKHAAEYAKCARTSVYITNLVDGLTKVEQQYCEHERMYDLDGRCGPAGKFFEPAKVAA